MAERLGKMESRLNELEGKVATNATGAQSQQAALKDASDAAARALAATDKLGGEVNQLHDQVQAANSKADQSLAVANQAASQMKSSDDEAKAAQAAATRAEAASKEAEQAAKVAQNAENKSEKIFGLEQKK